MPAPAAAWALGQTTPIRRLIWPPDRKSGRTCMYPWGGGPVHFEQDFERDPSPEPRRPPERPTARGEEGEQGEGERRRPPPVERERGHPGDRGEPHNPRRRARDEQPVEQAPPGAGGGGGTRGIARHARRNIGRIHAVAGAFAGPRFLPA